ncbi:trehalose transporter [Histoplasma capsulatum var. duboisii H88]|uniref:Trehalose transporter n=1 Tax=Ajellomyces capsulatus (strain H88) TaxID=544711 RepID=F0U7N0_AJEC8|nr:trehalose transporter [Histoplasma capsulatum var. duboisii H88]
MGPVEKPEGPERFSVDAGDAMGSKDTHITDDSHICNSAHPLAEGGSSPTSPKFHIKLRAKLGMVHRNCIQDNFDESTTEATAISASPLADQAPVSLQSNPSHPHIGLLIEPCAQHICVWLGLNCMTDHRHAVGVEPPALDADCATLRSSSQISRNAKLATDKEQRMTLLQGVKLYPKAAAWSVLISTCIVMEGYDVCLVNNFYAFPQWNQKYGVQLENGNYQVPATWQAALSNGAVVGEIIGLFINGWASERFGYRYTIVTCLLFLAGFITIFFTAARVEALLVGEILCGIPWGVFQTLCVSYATEVCPVALRSYLTTYVNFCWGLGQLLGIGVLQAMLSRPDEWSYRIPYALQWIWPVPLALVILMAPESPWWLVRKGKTEDAKRALLRLTSLNPETGFDADETIAMIVHTTALEQKLPVVPAILTVSRESTCAGRKLFV